MSILNSHPHDRVQVFIDGPNLYGTLRSIEMKIDYKALIAFMVSETRFIRAQYFTTIRPQFDNDKFHSVLRYIEACGYHMTTKNVKEQTDKNGNVRAKGSMLVEMTVAMMESADNGTDHIVVFSGDGELTAAVEACKALDCRVTVISSERGHVISDDLRMACDQYVDIEELPDNVVIELMDKFME